MSRTATELREQCNRWWAVRTGLDTARKLVEETFKGATEGSSEYRVAENALQKLNAK